MNWNVCISGLHLDQEVLHLKNRHNIYSTTLEWSHFHSGGSQPEWPLYSTCRPPMTGFAGFWQDLTSKLYISQQNTHFWNQWKMTLPFGSQCIVSCVKAARCTLDRWTAAVRWVTMNMCDTWLYQPNKLAVARMAGYTDCLVKEATEDWLHSYDLTDIQYSL